MDTGLLCDIRSNYCLRILQTGPISKNTSLHRLWHYGDGLEQPDHLCRSKRRCPESLEAVRQGASWWRGRRWGWWPCPTSAQPLTSPSQSEIGNDLPNRVYLSHFLIRPVLQKILLWINKLSFIQKYKLKKKHLEIKFKFKRLTLCCESRSEIISLLLTKRSKTLLAMPLTF